MNRVRANYVIIHIQQGLERGIEREREREECAYLVGAETATAEQLLCLLAVLAVV